MKKSEMYRRLNRSQRTFLSRSQEYLNRDILMGEICYNSSPNVGVKIIELESTNNSRNVSVESEHDKDDPYNGWNYVDNTLKDESGEQNCDTNNQNGKYDNTLDEAEKEAINDYVYNRLYGNNSNGRMNYFVNTLAMMNTSSDSENCEDDLRYRNHNNETYDHNHFAKELIGYQDGDDENGTIYICSYDGRYLTQHDYEITNIPGTGDCRAGDSNIKELSPRIPTPVPKVHVPKLEGLTPTLPIVTEVTEPRKLSSSTSETSRRKLGFQLKTTNSWFSPTSRDKEEKATNTDIEVRPKDKIFLSKYTNTDASYRSPEAVSKENSARVGSSRIIQSASSTKTAPETTVIDLESQKKIIREITSAMRENLGTNPFIEATEEGNHHEWAIAEVVPKSDRKSPNKVSFKTESPGDKRASASDSPLSFYLNMNSADRERRTKHAWFGCLARCFHCCK